MKIRFRLTILATFIGAAGLVGTALAQQQPMDHSSMGHGTTSQGN